MYNIETEKDLKEIIVGEASLMHLFDCKKLLIHISFHNLKHYFTLREHLSLSNRELADIIIRHARLTASNGNVTIAARMSEIMQELTKGIKPVVDEDED